jgi:aminopeptidase N
MMVGVNEPWYGWLAEGFNQYMNNLSGAAFRDTTPRLNGTGRSYGRIAGLEAEPPMMWDANYDGPMYSFVTYGKAPLMLSMLGAVVGDSAVQRAMSGYAKAWRFKHPSPWDYMFYMDNALHQDLGWFWYYWLFSTATVDNSITGVKTSGAQVTVSVRQDGDMPSPVVLDVTFAGKPPSVAGLKNATVSGNTVRVTYPVDVWFDGRRTFDAVMRFSGQKITTVVVDPDQRFPDSNEADNTWPRQANSGS